MNDTLIGLARLTLEDPRRATRVLLGLGVPLPARTAGLLLIAVLSTLITQLGFLVLPTASDPVSAFVLANPILAAVIQWLILAATVLLVFQIGRSWGGSGNLADALLIVVWLQLMMLGLQVVQLLALILSAPLAGLVNIAGMVLFFWLLSSFIAELHGFASRWLVFLGILAVSFVLAFVLVMVLAFVLGPEVLQNV
jgi:hypothetical protein